MFQSEALIISFDREVAAIIHMLDYALYFLSKVPTKWPSYISIHIRFRCISQKSWLKYKILQEFFESIVSTIYFWEISPYSIDFQMTSCWHDICKSCLNIFDSPHISKLKLNQFHNFYAFNISKRGKIFDYFWSLVKFLFQFMFLTNNFFFFVFPFIKRKLYILVGV